MCKLVDEVGRGLRSQPQEAQCGGSAGNLVCGEGAQDRDGRGSVAEVAKCVEGLKPHGQGGIAQH